VDMFWLKFPKYISTKCAKRLTETSTYVLTYSRLHCGSTKAKNWNWPSNFMSLISIPTKLWKDLWNTWNTKWWHCDDYDTSLILR
jgi:hypothetical protein